MGDACHSPVGAVRGRDTIQHDIVLDPAGDPSGTRGDISRPGIDATRVILYGSKIVHQVIFKGVGGADKLDAAISRHADIIVLYDIVVASDRNAEIRLNGISHPRDIAAMGDVAVRHLIVGTVDVYAVVEGIIDGRSLQVDVPGLDAFKGIHPRVKNAAITEIDIIGLHDEYVTHAASLERNIIEEEILSFIDEYEGIDGTGGDAGRACGRIEVHFFGLLVIEPFAILIQGIKTVLDKKAVFVRCHDGAGGIVPDGGAAVGSDIVPLEYMSVLADDELGSCPVGSCAQGGAGDLGRVAM
jgi:hypothetical protein